jgi:hypothetical protein
VVAQMVLFEKGLLALMCQFQSSVS